MKAVREQTLSTQQIKEILRNFNLDFDTTVNKSLNSYLEKIFPSCPFTSEICTKKQCLGCEVFISATGKS